VFLVAQQHSSESADILLDVVKNDPDPEVRKQGVFWMGQVEGDRPVELLGEVLKTSDDIEMQKRALFALSQHEGSKAAELVRSYAEREDIPEDLQRQAIFYIGQRESADNAAYLRGLYGRLKSSSTKERVLFSISQTHGEGSGRWLLEVASNDKEPMELRKKALFWAGQQNSSDLTTFTGLYDKMSSREMKEQLIFVYSQRHESAAVDKLLEIAQKEPDRELRKKAIFWLSQSNDPRVVKFLEDILNR
jgi:HEAT repeat protein